MVRIQEKKNSKFWEQCFKYSDTGLDCIHIHFLSVAFCMFSQTTWSYLFNFYGYKLNLHFKPSAFLFINISLCCLLACFLDVENDIHTYTCLLESEHIMEGQHWNSLLLSMLFVLFLHYVRPSADTGFFVGMFP